MVEGVEDERRISFLDVMEKEIGEKAKHHGTLKGKVCV